ncbi:D-alanyl-D-alanine carboxypeptidase family protein [Microbacterium pygmaeum]|uniref:D-alanyl-D-alanine carboxypeptidase (Penicillin-binding protein 5/6) n=1 Tax=Microbacterium pygmaeum TaxID=370764 RepID=A0A1G7VS62_9MICO|nr:D-alanyl-D-alanine carboxypeptidase [Microbacterium pygmaeum]SDG62652.1 D-alanyl-D-alanine carboxypeptidase (penicillin-binding protein 5/6) [Microbacterium pygmaeum]
MTSEDPPAQTRRRLRETQRSPESGGDASSTATLTDADATAVYSAAATLTAAPAATTSTVIAAAAARPAALSWVDERAVASAPSAAPTLEAAGSPYLPAQADLLAVPPRRSLLRAGVVVPTLIIAALAGAYAATTLLWPLHAIPPAIEAVEVQAAVAPPAVLNWPASGSAAVAVDGIGGPIASAVDPSQMASITKVITALLVLEEMPLALGETGPEFRFTQGDSDEYWDYLSNNESALDVPVGGTLSEYQLLQGMLIGSAGNYADRLAYNIWPSQSVYAAAASTWLTAHGVNGITVVEPTGLDPRNTATPESMMSLAKLAMANPVIAEIVGTQSVDLPGAGLVTNTNGLLADPGVVGIKTGSLDAYTLLSGKNVQVGETTVRVYAVVLGQPDDDTRLAASRQLYADVELGLQPAPSVPQGTVTGHVTTAWGEEVDVITAADASVILFNGGSGAVSTTFSLGDALSAGETVGSLAVQGPLNSTTVELELADDVEPPSAWWRLTHPLELLGIS